MKRFTVSVALATLLASNILSMKSLAESKPPDFISAAGFENLLSQVSNWGRWGEDDQLGTLNLITTETRISASNWLKPAPWKS